MALFYVGGRFPGPGVKISKNRPRIRIPGPKLPIWGSFCVHQAIFKKWQFSTWVVAPTLSSLWFFIRLNQFDMHQIAKTRGYNSTSRYIYISQYCDREGHLKLKNGQKQPFFSIFWKKKYPFCLYFFFLAKFFYISRRYRTQFLLGYNMSLLLPLLHVYPRRR